MLCRATDEPRRNPDRTWLRLHPGTHEGVAEFPVGSAGPEPRRQTDRRITPLPRPIELLADPSVNRREPDELWFHAIYGCQYDRSQFAYRQIGRCSGEIDLCYPGPQGLSLDQGPKLAKPTVRCALRQIDLDRLDVRMQRSECVHSYRTVAESSDGLNEDEVVMRAFRAASQHDRTPHETQLHGPIAGESNAHAAEHSLEVPPIHLCAGIDSDGDAGSIQDAVPADDASRVTLKKLAHSPSADRIQRRWQVLPHRPVRSERN